MHDVTRRARTCYIDTYERVIVRYYSANLVSSRSRPRFQTGAQTAQRQTRAQGSRIHRSGIHRVCCRVSCSNGHWICLNWINGCWSRNLIPTSAISSFSSVSGRFSASCGQTISPFWRPPLSDNPVSGVGLRPTCSVRIWSRSTSSPTPWNFSRRLISIRRLRWVSWDSGTTPSRSRAL